MKYEMSAMDCPMNQSILKFLICILVSLGLIFFTYSQFISNRTARGFLMERISEIHVNGTKLKVDADAERSLLSVLRDDLDLTGSKYGCGEGQCGACTVLIDGQPVRSCITKLRGAVGKKI